MSKSSACFVANAVPGMSLYFDSMMRRSFFCGCALLSGLKHSQGVQMSNEAMTKLSLPTRGI